MPESLNLPQVLNSLNTASSPSYSMEDILRATQPRTKGGGFKRVLGGILGGIGSIFMPGVGGIIGSAIAGSAGAGLPVNPGGVFNDALQYLQFQRELSQQQEVLEAASAVLKSRHDASMNAIRNIN